VRRRDVAGELQRRDRPDHLAADTQRLAAGGEYPHVRTGTQQPLGELGTGLEQMLAVVQHQQQLARLQARLQHVFHRAAGLLAEVQCRGHRLG
jgi:hypothetical protein